MVLLFSNDQLHFFPTADKPKDTARWCYGFTALFLSVRSLEIFQGMECIWGFSSMLNGSDSVIYFYNPLFVDPSIH
jgi:hypothetical protein